MKIDKKTKYILSAITLTGLVTIPTAIALTSCSSKPQQDKIEYYQNANGAIFTDANGNKTTMTQEETPFKCDFNLTNKTCTIVEWFSNQPNYFTEGLPPREGLSESLQKSNNTIRIPSLIKYNNQDYKVVGFSSFRGTYTERNLSFDNILSNYTQVIEFDINLTELSNENKSNDVIEIENNPTLKQDVLKILNFPSIERFSIVGLKKLEVFTFNPNFNVDCTPSFEGCSKLRELKIPNGVESIGLKQFKNCTSLESITIPNTVTEIFDRAFEACSALKSITFPSSIKTYGGWIFDQTSYPDTFRIHFPSQEAYEKFLPGNENVQKYCVVDA